MKKNIIIGVLSLICLLLLVFARIQTAEAEKQKLLAEENFRIAEQHRTAAKNAEEVASRAAAEAIREKKKAEEALADCLRK